MSRFVVVEVWEDYGIPYRYYKFILNKYLGARIDNLQRGHSSNITFAQFEIPDDLSIDEADFDYNKTAWKTGG